MKLVLASQSPRRQELLSLMGLDFTVRVADIDETMDTTKDPKEEVARVSRAKAMAVPAAPDELVIAADTIVVCDGKLLGKPGSPENAVRTLRLLSGREHQVMTGLTLRKGDTILSHTEVSSIHFRELDPREIEAYVATGEPLDKAGAYGIQGKAAVFVTRLEGDYYNVMGLPVCTLTQRLRELGVPVLGV